MSKNEQFKFNGQEKLEDFMKLFLHATLKWKFYRLFIELHNHQKTSCQIIVKEFEIN